MRITQPTQDQVERRLRVAHSIRDADTLQHRYGIAGIDAVRRLG
jgi:hypothetical protein